MASGAAAASPEGRGREDACSVLLDVQAYVGAGKNASTARSKTSTGHTIEVTFCIVPPPALSHISVHCPDLQLPPDDLDMAPQAVATTDDLIVLRVPIDPLGRNYFQFNDYFVYRAHHQDPKLDLLPNPQPYWFRDQEIAILSCGPVTADGGNQYVVAALKSQPSFRLHLYRSKPGGETGSWTVQPVSVKKPLRDSVCPIPDTAKRLLYHVTTKVITLGGANGTVGWVDLWRGILLCDVLEESPKLRDIPLPLPAKGNWRRFLRDGERFVRDITVSQHKDSIKYVEMEIVPPRVVTTTSSPDPATYLEWVHHKECLPLLMPYVVPGRWKATTWSMPIPVTSWDDWHTECNAESQEFHISDPRHCELLQELMSSSGGHKEAKQATLSLGSLHMGYPAFSIDDDVVYLSCKAARRGLMGLVAAVDVRKKELRGVAKLDIKRNTCFMRSYIATEISKYLKTTGTCAVLFLAMMSALVVNYVYDIV